MLKNNRRLHRRRPVIQSNMRHPMYSGAHINITPQRLANDIINIKFEKSTEAGLSNVLNFTQNKCRLKQKKLLRQKHYGFYKSIQQLDQTALISYQGKNNEEEYENDTETSEIDSEYLIMQMENLEIDSDNYSPATLFRGFTPENDSINDGKNILSLENMYDFNEKHEQLSLDVSNENLGVDFDINSPRTIFRGFTPENNSENYGMNIESLENMSDFYEQAEQELQVNDELRVVIDTYDNEHIIDHTERLEADEQTAVTKPNNKFRIEILENIIVKPATSHRNDELQASDETVLNANLGDIENFDTNELFFGNYSFVNEHINDGEDKIIEANYEIASQQANKISNIEENQNIAPESNEFLTENISTQARDSEINASNESINENTDKPPQFDNFKVPKEVTHSKKVTVKKPQPRFILTHVVEGYIIQESNFAFPIRDPQSQRTTPQTSKSEESTAPVFQDETVDKEESGTKETVPTEVKEDTIDQKESGTEEPVLPTKVKKDETPDQEVSGTEELVPQEVKDETLHQVEITEEPVPPERKEEEVRQEQSVTEKAVPPAELKEDVKEGEENGECNPFARLQQTAVMSWTVAELSHHLHNSNWAETAALLEDNEVDGESLFLVSKAQLMTIGINEGHADVISEFIQSGTSEIEGTWNLESGEVDFWAGGEEF